MKASEVISLIREGNEEFHRARNEDYFRSHIDRQAPLITLLTCSDSRVQSQAVLPDPVNRIFSVENIGNQLATSEGSVDYGILHLKTPVLLIVGHSDCGAVKACCGDYSGETEAVRRELDSLLPFLSPGHGIPFRVTANIRAQAAAAQSRYAAQVAAGTLAVVGAYYDFANDLGRGYGKLVILSVNGETPAP